MFHLPSSLAAVAASAALCLAAPAAALPIVDGDFSGLSGAEAIVDFDEIALTPFQQVTSEFAALGVSFSPNVWFEDTRFFANFDGASLANFRSSAAPGGALPPIAFTLSFSAVMSDFAAFFATNTGNTITLEAFLGASSVETLAFTDTACCDGHVLGFSQIEFDSIQVSGTDLVILDEFHFENTAPPVIPEPSTSALLLPGLFGLALFGRRRPS